MLTLEQRGVACLLRSACLNKINVYHLGSITRIKGPMSHGIDNVHYRNIEANKIKVLYTTIL